VHEHLQQASQLWSVVMHNFLKIKKSYGKKEDMKLFEKPEVHITPFKLPQFFLYQVKYNQYGLGSHWQLNN